MDECKPLDRGRQWGTGGGDGDRAGDWDGDGGAGDPAGSERHAWLRMLPSEDTMRETHPLMWAPARRRALLAGSPTLTRLEAGPYTRSYYSCLLSRLLSRFVPICCL